MSVNMNKMNKNMVEEYAMGFMLEYTEDQYKNDETLEQIKNELINLYEKVHNNQLLKDFFYSMFCDEWHYSQSVGQNEKTLEKKFMSIMKDLIISLKKEGLEDFEEAWKVEEEYQNENGENSPFWDDFPACVYNFFRMCDKEVRKYKDLFLTNMSSNIFYGYVDKIESLKMTINGIVYTKIESMNKIILHTGSEKKEIKFDKRNTLKNIMKKVLKLQENESMHFIFEDKEFILYRSYKGFDCQLYNKWNFIKFLRYILNTKNTKLMSKYIHLIDSHFLKELSEEEKMKINKFIQISNKNNEILLKNIMCNDIIKYNINKMISPEEIEKVCVYEGEKIQKNVSEKVNSFLENCNEKNQKDFIKLMNEILKDVESIDALIKEKNYENMKKTIKIDMIKNLYRLNFTDLANTLFQKRPDFLQINKERAIDLKTKTDDVEFHRILECFLEKY